LRLADPDFNSISIPGNYGQRNIFKYEDSNFVERLDANGVFNISSDILPETVEVLTLIFSAVDLSEIITADARATSTPHYKFNYLAEQQNKMNTNGVLYTTVDGNDLRPGNLVRLDTGVYQVDAIIDNKNGTFTTDAGNQNDQDWQRLKIEKNSDSVHIAQIEEATPGANNYALFDGPDQYPNDLTFYPDGSSATFPVELQFSFIINNYFKRFVETISQPAIIQAFFDIPVLQFIQLDQTAPVYIESLGQNFYINKIEQYKIEGLTRVELIKV